MLPTAWFSTPPGYIGEAGVLGAVDVSTRDLARLLVHRDIGDVAIIVLANPPSAMPRPVTMLPVCSAEFATFGFQFDILRDLGQDVLPPVPGEGRCASPRSRCS